MGIIVRGSLTGTLTVESLGAALFLIGLVPVSRVDREHKRLVDGELVRPIIGWLTRRPPP